jgi:ABC-type transport system involved in multi-copper enzyme maturation permease subunit
MLVGPVFRAELVGTARRRRYYILRALYGAVLLLMIGLNYKNAFDHGQEGPLVVSIADMANFGQYLFLSFAVVQGVALLLLIPPLFGGVIADEKQRKTLHYLMASSLTSAEIVLDKLAGRALHVGVYVAIGLPVVCLIGLFGGVAIEYVAAAYVATAAITFFAAALTVLVSTLARRVRQAVLVSYLLLVGWIVGPVVVITLTVMITLTVRPLSPLLVFNALKWAAVPSPLVFYITYLMKFGGPNRTVLGLGPAVLVKPFLWMVGFQVAMGLLFLLIAIWQLRPTFRRQEVTRSRLNWFGDRPPRWRWLARPECGERAVLWKECHFTRTDVFTKLCVLPATIILTVVLVLFGMIDETGWLAFTDLARTGYATAGADSRLRFNESLRAVSPYYIALWLLAVAGASASSVTAEREQDTWVSLIATPLSGGAILLGKIFGAVWGLRGFGALMGLLWLAGLLSGAIHPLGLILALGVVSLLSWFVATLGVFASLWAPNTSRALTITLVTLFLLNAGYLIFPGIQGRSPDYRNELFVLTPYAAGQSLLSFADVRRLWENPASLGATSDAGRIGVMYAAIILLIYALAALALTKRAIGDFDALIGRPTPCAPRRSAPRAPVPLKGETIDPSFYKLGEIVSER